MCANGFKQAGIGECPDPLNRARIPVWDLLEKGVSRGFLYLFFRGFDMLVINAT